MLRITFIFTLLFCLFLTATGFSQEAASAQDTTASEIGKPVSKTLIDFADLPDNISIDKWTIKLSGYSDTPKGRSLSDLKLVNVDSSKIKNGKTFNKCLGIRVNFEYSHGNDWAEIAPVYPISVFYMKEGQGVVRNVGPIKSVSIWVSGRNYKNSIEVRMIDNHGKYKSINFGHLFFKGWRKLSWDNPNYIKELKKRDIEKPHLYPQYEPYLKFESLVLYKSPQEIGGDFIAYVKDIEIEYEPAILEYESAVNDEAEWHILETEAKQSKDAEDKRLDIYFSGSTKEAQYLKDKKAQETKETK
ncbi:MAG: hypothetical protein JW827_08280 [Spirochaetes bacterium]|nr:hypothetical protein [Spirochaetota bacterium]